jgi:hypothetical protein
VLLWGVENSSVTVISYAVNDWLTVGAQIICPDDVLKVNEGVNEGLIL